MSIEVPPEYPRYIKKGEFKPYDPIKVSKWTEEIVCKYVDGEQWRKYTSFYGAGVYRGIATGAVVGCNLRCFFCWSPLSRDFPERYGTYYSPKEVCENLVKVARKYGFRKARLSCGEPTIGKDHLLKVLEYVERCDYIKLFILETNGILMGLDRDYVRDVLKFSKVYVRISLKAGTPEAFTWKTGAVPQAFELPFKTIEYFVEEGAWGRFHVAVMSDPRIMSKEERVALLEKLYSIDPKLLRLIEEEVVDPYDTTLFRLKEAGVELDWSLWRSWFS